MPLVLAGATSGSTTIQATDAVTQTLTLPNATGTVMVNGPAFNAYQSVAVALSASTSTKMTFTNVVYDTNSNYSTSTSRFTPTVAGYYQVNAVMNINFSVTGVGFLYIYKNGSQVVEGGMAPGNSFGAQVGVSYIIYMNGSTDYLEIYGLQTSSASQNTSPGALQAQFQAVLVRGA